MSTPISSKSDHRFFLLFAILIILEICFNFYFFPNVLGQDASAFGLFGISVLSGIYIIYFYYKKQLIVPSVQRAPRPLLLNIGLMAVGFAVLAIALHRIFAENEINYKNSDIIPLVQVLVSRFVHGAQVYTPVADFGYTIQPNYLPMHWMPYTVASLFKIDPRWIAISINLIAGCWLIIRNARFRDQRISVLVPLLMLFNWFVIYKNNNGVFSSTIEMMVAGYYMMLIIGQNCKSAVITGLTISFCLLSRFSLVLWLPLWVFVEWFSGNRKYLLIAMSTIAIFVLLVYVIPFLSYDWSSFKKGYDYYTVSAIGEWNHFNDKQQPAHLFDGHGFAYLFYNRSSYSLEERITYLQKFHILACGFTVCLLGLFYWFKKKLINYKVFLMGSFKIYLAVFLAFIQVPYSYLMITGTFVSIAILSELFKYKTVEH